MLPFSPWKVKSLSHVQLFATPWTLVMQTRQASNLSGLTQWGLISHLATILCSLNISSVCPPPRRNSGMWASYTVQGSSIHGIFQARILEWVAISFSRGSSRLRHWTQVSSIADSLASEPQGNPIFCPFHILFHWTPLTKASSKQMELSPLKGRIST